MNPTEFFTPSRQSLPDGVLPIMFQPGTRIPFDFVREIGYWPSKDQGLTLDACQRLFRACGVSPDHAVMYHTNGLPSDVPAQLEHARETAYRLRQHLMDQHQKQADAPDPSRPGYLDYTPRQTNGRDVDVNPTYRLHDAWASKTWNESTAEQMFLAYGLSASEGRAWFVINGDVTVHPRFGITIDPVYECAYRAWVTARDRATNTN